MNTKIAEDSKTGSTRKVVIECIGVDFASKRQTPHPMGYTVVEERDLLKAIPHLISTHARGGHRLSINVYELGSIMYDNQAVEALKAAEEKNIRYQEYLALKKEFKSLEENED